MSSAPPSTNGPLFSGLYALFVLLHQLKQLPVDEPVGVTAIRIAMCMVAAALLARPNRLALLFAVSMLQLLGVFSQLPTMSNSWMMAGCLSVGVALCCAPALRRDTTVDAVWPALQPTVAVSLIVFYGFAALAKFNTAFIDPSVSCATDFYAALATTFPLPRGAWVDTLTILGTLVVEAGIPALFLFRRTRVLGIALGLAFHAGISMSPRVHIYDFSLLMYVGYVALAPADLHRQLVQHPRLGVARSISGARLPLLGLLTVAGAGALALSPVALHLTRAFVWDGLALFFVVTGWAALRSCEPTNPLPRPTSATLIAAGLVFLNGAAPYVGLKTTVAFTMFSNLATEPGHANHLFVPEMRLFHFQDDLFEVVASDHPVVVPAEGVLWPGFELGRFLEDAPDTQLTLRDGSNVVAGRAADHPWFATPSPLAAKFLSFRGVQPGSNRCLW